MPLIPTCSDLSVKQLCDIFRNEIGLELRVFSGKEEISGSPKAISEICI